MGVRATRRGGQDAEVVASELHAIAAAERGDAAAVQSIVDELAEAIDKGEVADADIAKKGKELRNSKLLAVRNPKPPNLATWASRLCTTLVALSH